MKVTRKFTKAGQDVFTTVKYDKRTSRISNPDGTVVFEMTNAEIPESWSQLATDIMVSKYFRKAGVPQIDPNTGLPMKNADGTPVFGPERSARQVINRLAGCWRCWGETHGYFDTKEDAQAFYDELAYMLLHQMVAPNSPQWFNTGLNYAYNITGPAQGHFYCDPKTGELKKSADAYTHPQPHACFIQSVSDDLVNPGGIMDLWTREARLFKYGSGTGSNFSRLRGENESLSGGGKSSGLMSFLKIGDRAAGAIKSGGTTRRAAKMVCLDLDHPDVEQFINWKVREELKVAALAEGMKILPKEHQELAKKLGLKLDYDFNGEAYYTVSGQNSNNSVRIPNSFFKALEDDGDWTLTNRTNKKVAKKLKARDLWAQICFAAWRCADPGVQYDDTINQWHTCPKSGRINASNPCVTGDTRVLTPGGVWRRIDQMIHLPSRVVTNTTAQEIHYTDGAFPTGTKPTFTLRTSCGYTVTLTADHQIYTRSRGWVPAGDLQPTDELKLPSIITDNEIGQPQDATFFQLVGLMLSSANADVNNLDLATLPAHADRLSDYISDIWGSPEDTRGGLKTLTVTNRRLMSRLRAYARFEHGLIRLSDEAFTAGLAAQRHILQSLFTADGVLTRQTLVLKAESTGLLSDLQLVLLGFGIKSTVVGQQLSIDPACLGAFARHISLLNPTRQDGLLSLASTAAPAELWDTFHSLTPAGTKQVFDLTEPTTHSFIAGGITVHNCSEYMFLDDTACNLASLNVLKFFDSETRNFDIEGYRHSVRLWTIVLEISVLMASFPSEEIATLSYRYRTLGLGYANLGAMLMQAGIPYDSAKGRAVCAALTSILTGESYATSAEMAKQLGAFPGYADNSQDMLRVMRNHRRAAHSVGGYEGLDIQPVEIDSSLFGDDPLLTDSMLAASRDCWDRAIALGEKHGYRNAQSTVIAPTGTIGLLMDCDTTGVEPDFALVKFKKLSGGGYFKIANQSLKPALQNLGYTPTEISDILRYVMGSLSLHDSPHINRYSLKLAGLTETELDKIEESLPGQFELGFAFSPWTLGADALQRLHIPESEWQQPNFSLLRKFGFTRKQIDEANDVVCGRGTVEGAPHLKPEHYPVFDCANKCGKIGQRFIAVEGHIRMMAAAQPFISGAISKTINLPNEATESEIASAYKLSWELGLKANALYRDGSKLSQPLNVKSDTDLDKSEQEDEDDLKAAREEVASDVAKAASAIAGSDRKALLSDNLTTASPDHTRVIEKIVERVVERPLRRRLPDTRHALTHKFDVAGHEGYITVGLYEDGAPGEVFITMAKEGSTIGGLMDTIATLVSVSLQYGVGVESLVRKFEHVRFEPSGMTRNQEIPFAKSLVDYIFRWLAMEFVPGYRTSNAPSRSQPKTDDEPAAEAPASASAASARAPADATKPVAYDAGPAVATSTAKRLAVIADPLSQQGSEMQADAPACDVCGSITVRSGTCYKCLNCGNSMGCS
jgi:ribonucleoside-diphosphate reductase alpha chain